MKLRQTHQHHKPTGFHSRSRERRAQLDVVSAIDWAGRAERMAALLANKERRGC
jgi:hypothetical protein